MLKNDLHKTLDTPYGSILTVQADRYDALVNFIEKAGQEAGNLLFRAWIDEVEQRILPLIQQAKWLSAKYDVIVTNPPYMNPNVVNGILPKYVKKHFSDSKADMFACFIERNLSAIKSHRYIAMITQHSWMFLSSYEKLRQKLNASMIINMAHLGARAFEEIAGEVVQTTSFVLASGYINNYKTIYDRLLDPVTQQGKEEMFLHGKNRFIVQRENFIRIPGMIFAYWITPSVYEAFNKGHFLKHEGESRQGLGTSDNVRFLRFWWEILFTNIGFRYKSCTDTLDCSYKWFPYIKGGVYRRWYPNKEHVVNYYNNGEDIKKAVLRKYPYLKSPDFVVKNTNTYFHKGITWSDVSTGKFSARYVDNGYIYADAGPMFFPFSDDSVYLAYMNTVVFQEFASLICQGLHYSTGQIPEIPFILFSNEETSDNVQQNVSISKADWDAFETSWDFARHPLLVRPTATLAAAYEQYKAETNARFDQLRCNEEELNRIFIDIYGLANELTPEVEDKDVTVSRIFDTKEELPASMKGSNYAIIKADVMKSLISYAVGCMFGRYSLDMPGLVYAGGEWDDSKYTTFLPDEDAILPICDDEYFDDDIVGRFVEFIEAVFGKETLEENLQFIADALGGRGSSREVIRSYFLTGFYADHVKTYQKRPIYWLFDSGKKNGFKCLVYMHRYCPDTIARIRTDYVHEQQSRYRTVIESLEQARDNAATAGDKVKAGKKLAAVEAQAKELLEYEEKIHHLADQMIAIDLDDGVKHNHAIFQDVLAKIK